MDDTETLLAGLQDIRLPADAPGGLLAEMLVVIGMALGLALLVSLALRVVLRRPERTAVPLSLSMQVAALRDRPADDRVIGLLALIRTHAPGALPGLRSRIYGTGTPVEPAELEALLLAKVDA